MEKDNLLKDKTDRVPLIIPSYEPDERLIFLIDKLISGYSDPIIIVNDGSDKSYQHYFEYAEEKGCIILNHYVNMGKGRALKSAFNYCLNHYPQMIGTVTADSDGQHTIMDILKCRDSLIKNPNHFILGCRDFEHSDVPAKSKFGNKITRSVCHVLCGLEISDTQTGLRGIPSSFMSILLNTEGERFEFETKMLIQSNHLLPIQEIKIQTIYDSKENHQTHFHPIRDSIKIYQIFGEMLLKFCVVSLSSCMLDLFLFSEFHKFLGGGG